MMMVILSYVKAAYGVKNVCPAVVLDEGDFIL